MDTYHGHVRTPADAIKLFEACRLGLLPRVQRRLSEKERQSIKSGSVFVWDEREAGMRRWTDGKSWSASRVSGSFLTYREMEGKRGGGQFVPPPDSGRASDEDMDMDGEGPDGYRYKPDGLMKQSFSITTSTGQHLHLISYYSRPHSNAQELMQPTNDPQLRHIVPVKGMYPESTVHEAQGPAVTRAPMQPGPYMQTPHQQMPGQRGPPPYPSPYQVAQQSYAWPPSPMSTPPFPHHPGSMYQSALPPPPPGSQHPSPYQHQQGPGSQNSSPYQSHQYIPHHQNNIPPSAVHQAQPTIFDRAPPPLTDSSLPPPPPQQIHRGMSNATAQNLMPAYQANPSPRIAQARAVAEQAQQQAQAQMAQRALQNSSMAIDPRLSEQPPPPQQQQHQQYSAPIPVMNGTPRTASSRTISPRTTTPPQNQSSPKSPGSASLKRESSPKDQSPSKQNGNSTSQAQNIPSISSLVHPENSVSVMSDNKSNSSNSRAGSRSPKENGEQRPKDIPHDKLNNLGEDQRAIRVLDRKFCV